MNTTYSDNLVTAENLSRRVGNRTVLDNLTFDLPHQGTIGLVQGQDRNYYELEGAAS